MFGANKLKFNRGQNMFMEESKGDFFLQIQKQARRKAENGNPVLIFFKTNDFLYEYYESTYLPVDKDKILILN